uniref:MIB/HERC2 domain-containing protein n=1 Tax=Alexandrium catenella TaxID=2925 RepID=A0A7S1WEL9_ALECA|mmetsp:Transcript_54675/g.146357  ORF Transcript_54675/g.146357 Transcript_54675/m.146357 type:complete len:498 (+) Transcript_54675:188-1681(+)
MLWVNCCRIVHTKDVQDVSAVSEVPYRKKFPKPLNPHGRSVNVGIGSLAAGEITLAEVLPPASAFKSHDPGVSGAQAGLDPNSGDELMPYRRQKTSNVREFGRRRSIECMEGYLVGGAQDGVPETPQDQQDIAVSDHVVRGPDWCWGDEDGGTGCTGSVIAIDLRSRTVQVSWRATSRTYKHYRCGDRRDLVLAPKNPESEEMMGHNSSKASSLLRANTKDLFAHPTQTFIVLDWDDTLFPTTYVRDDLGLCWQTPMRNQRLDPKEKAEVSRNLQRCAENCCSLLRAAVSFGKVVLVTLAKSPWVTVSCDHFFPAVGCLIQELGVPIIYAQEGSQVEYNKAEMTTSESIEKHWSMVKGKAISKEIGTFYSQYAGQSWKNIISIGDSDFERLGTMQATEGYMKQTGISRSKTVEVSGHVYKVRTKTFKMLDQPSVDELTVELAMVQKWLPLMIQLDSSFDVNLDDLEDPATLRRIERTLRGQQRMSERSENGTGRTGA